MLGKDFGEFLDQALAAEQQGLIEATAQEAIAWERQQAVVDESARRALAEIRQRNQTVVDLNARLPIGQYLEAIRNQIAPRQPVKTWGPENGQIAHAFCYRAAINRIVIKRIMRGCDGTKGSRSWSEDIYGLRVVHDALGVVLNDKGEVYLNPYQQIAKSSAYPYKKNLDPLSWDLSRDKKAIPIVSPEGLRQFAQALADFYVGLKIGR